jgi:hypothetical protein
VSSVALPTPPSGSTLGVTIPSAKCAAACLNRETSPSNDIAAICPHGLSFSRKVAITVTAAGALKLYLLQTGTKRMASTPGNA